MRREDISKIDLENVCIHKDTVSSLIKEFGVKMCKIISRNSDMSEESVDKIVSSAQAMEIKKAFILEEKRDI